MAKMLQEICSQLLPHRQYVQFYQFNRNKLFFRKARNGGGGSQYIVRFFFLIFGNSIKLLKGKHCTSQAKFSG